MSQNGRHELDHRGTLTLTNNRLIFSSPTKSQGIDYREIISHTGGLDLIRVQVEGQPAGTFFFSTSSPIPYAIFSAAVAMANHGRVAGS